MNATARNILLEGDIGDQGIEIKNVIYMFKYKLAYFSVSKELNVNIQICMSFETRVCHRILLFKEKLSRVYEPCANHLVMLFLFF